MVSFSLPTVSFHNLTKSEKVVVVDLVSVGPTTNIKIASEKQKKSYSKDSELAKPKAAQVESKEEGEKLPIKKDITSLKKKPLTASKNNKTDSLKLQNPLKAVKNTAKKTSLNHSAKDEKGITGKGKPSYNKSKPQTMNISESIRSQFIHCWSIPHGALNVEHMQVKVNIMLDEEGKVLNTNVVDINHYKKDSFFRAMADSALRAVHRCSPLQGLPKEQHNLWKNMELVFDPKDMF